MYHSKYTMDASEYSPRRAMVDACHLWRERRLEELLRRDLPWRTVRRRVLGSEVLGTRWTGRVLGKAMRLSRYGLEYREQGEIRRCSWRRMQEMIHWDRS